MEKTHLDIVAEKKAIEERLQTTGHKLRELEQQIEEEDRESSELGIHRRRLAQQLQDERLQHQKDLAERDFAGDQTRKKYQGNHPFVIVRQVTHLLPAELAQLSEGMVCSLLLNRFLIIYQSFNPNVTP